MARTDRPANPLHRVLALGSVALAAVLPLNADAQPVEGPWRWGASVYLYVPSVGASTSIPADPSGTPINVDVLSKLEFALMGSLDVHNGRWGGFTDFVYLDFGDTAERTRSFTIGSGGLPAGTAARIEWNLKGLAWTAAGQYRLVSDPNLRLDAIAGARLLDIREKARWDISGNIGPLAPSGRSGSSDVKLSLWDGIVGLKGRQGFGAGNPWSLPFYVDVGTGESRLTWQAAAGVTYGFAWGEVSALWRYLAYEMKPGGTISELNFNGPMVGLTWRW